MRYVRTANPSSARCRHPTGCYELVQFYNVCSFNGVIWNVVLIEEISYNKPWWLVNMEGRHLLYLFIDIHNLAMYNYSSLHGPLQLLN